LVGVLGPVIQVLRSTVLNPGYQPSVGHTVAGQLVVTSIRGTYRNTVRSLRKNLMAALALRRR
jgi:hypothetical protein